MESRNKMINVVLFIIYVILSSSGLILFKLGSLNPNLNLNIFGYSLIFSIKSIIGVFCYGFSFLLWLVIVSRMNLTVAMPLSVGIVNTLVLIGSIVFLQEKITITQIIGIVTIVTGVFLITINR